MVVNSAPKVWFVTGASSGLGKAVVEHALKKGDKVSATCRKPEALSSLASQYPSSQLIVLKLEVTSSSDITAAFAQTISAFERIDVVYNNAGYCLFSEIEGTPDDVARHEFEVNFWGATNVSREAVRVFRDVNKPAGGRLLQASSIAGVSGTAGLGFYCATKFALEAISEALAKEIHPSWNIKITSIELGAYDTPAPQSAVIVPQHPAYELPDSATTMMRAYSAGPLVQGDTAKAAREIYNIGGDDSVGLHVPLGLDAVAALSEKIEELKSVVETTGKWSLDLKKD